MRDMDVNRATQRWSRTTVLGFGTVAGLVFALPVKTGSVACPPAGEGRVNVEAPGVRRLGHVEDLGSLYAGALAVVLPSWIEGFGLTPVEGIAAGTPAIVSDLAVLREVLGEGALYVRPGDASGLADALLRVAAEPDLRERLLTAGRAAIAPLSWAETALRTRAVLAEAAAA